MRVSVRLFGLGLLLVCIGMISLWQPEAAEEVAADTTNRTSEVLSSATATPVAEPIATTRPRTTRTPLPVTIIPTATEFIRPTAQPISQDTVLLNDNMYRESFTDTNSGWDAYYAGDGGAWNGYTPSGYSFQLASDAQLAVGRRIWDFNTCCVLDAQYRVSFEAESASPQRGMIITDFVGDYGSMDTASGIIVLFEIGYNMQPRPQPVQIVMLQQGYLTSVQCTGASSLVVGPRMKVSVTVVNNLLTVNLLNRDSGTSAALRCGLNERSSDPKRLGMGAVRLPNTTNQMLTPLVYTYMEIAGISGYITDSVPAPLYGYISAGCNAQSVYRFEDWLNEDIVFACPVY